MIRAVEARTMDTGVAPFKTPAVVTHSEFATVERERHATEQKAEAVAPGSRKARYGTRLRAHRLLL